ncbi:MAG: hypothetical protein QM702_14640 [Rubrivivax sp.]
MLFSVPLWLQSLRGEVDRAVFSLDGLLALAIGFVFRGLGFVLVLLAWALDVLLSQSINYHFKSPLDFLESARFGGALNWTELFTWSDGLVLAAFVAAALSLRRLLRLRPSWPALAAIFVALLTADALNGSSAISERDVRFTRANIAGSPAFVVGTAFTKKTQSARPVPFADPPAGRLFDAVLNWAQANPQGSVLMVVVESLGQPVAPPVRRWLDEQMSVAVAGGHQVEGSSVLFTGATTSGELRSLCMLDGTYDQLDATLGATCLPRRLEALGWHARGYHGFTGNMFERRVWWPKIGLSDANFAEQLRGRGLPLCGAAFRGFCDGDLLTLAAAELKPRTLAYVLTLNTHIPLPPQDVDPALRSLCGANGVADGACKMLAALGGVLRRVGVVASQSPGTLVVVAGDHAPPFTDRQSRHAFDAHRVPAWLFTPKRMPASVGAAPSMDGLTSPH